GLADFLERPAHPHVACVALAAVGGCLEGGDGWRMGHGFTSHRLSSLSCQEPERASRVPAPSSAKRGTVPFSAPPMEKRDSPSFCVAPGVVRDGSVERG